MKKILRYYYDTKGNKIEPTNIENEDIEDEATFHNEIAQQVINCNPELLNEYNEIRKKGVISTTIYLVMKGYIYVGGVENGNMSAMYSSISLNNKTKSIMNEFKQDGYFVYDVIRDELKKEQQQQIMNWYKNGMTREEIQHKVMEDMMTQLTTKNETEPQLNNNNNNNTNKPINDKEEDFER